MISKQRASSVFGMLRWASTPLVLSVLIIAVFSAVLIFRVVSQRTSNPARQSEMVLEFGVQSSTAVPERSEIFSLAPVEMLTAQQIQGVRELALSQFPDLLQTKYELSPLLHRIEDMSWYLQ